MAPQYMLDSHAKMTPFTCSIRMRGNVRNDTPAKVSGATNWVARIRPNRSTTVSQKIPVTSHHMTA